MNYLRKLISYACIMQIVSLNANGACLVPLTNLLLNKSFVLQDGENFNPYYVRFFETKEFNDFIEELFSKERQKELVTYIKKNKSDDAGEKVILKDTLYDIQLDEEFLSSISKMNKERRLKEEFIAKTHQYIIENLERPLLDSVRKEILNLKSIPVADDNELLKNLLLNEKYFFTLSGSFQAALLNFSREKAKKIIYSNRLFTNTKRDIAVFALIAINLQLYQWLYFLYDNDYSQMEEKLKKNKINKPKPIF